MSHSLKWRTGRESPEEDTTVNLEFIFIVKGFRKVRWCMNCTTSAFLIVGSSWPFIPDTMRVLWPAFMLRVFSSYRGILLTGENTIPALKVEGQEEGGRAGKCLPASRWFQLCILLFTATATLHLQKCSEFLRGKRSVVTLQIESHLLSNVQCAAEAVLLLKCITMHILTQMYDCDVILLLNSCEIIWLGLIWFQKIFNV